MSVGSRITKLRKNRGYTREVLAERANISVQFLSDIEKDKKSMTINTLRKLSKALFVITDYIVNGDEEPDESDELKAMLNAMSIENKKFAIKLLEVFIESTERKDK